MSRNVGWTLMAAVWGTLIGAMVTGCDDAGTVAEVDAALAEDFPGYVGGTIDEVVTVRARDGEVHVALAAGVPVFVGAESWSPTLLYIEATEGTCSFN